MMRQSRWLFLLFFFFLIHSGDAWSQEHVSDLVQRGQYIFSLAGGCACHTVPKGTFNAGARAFPIPLGKVYSTNITQDKETGLGSWTDQQIQDAIVKGIRRDGSNIIPVMPYQAYSGMAEEDLQALIAYLKTLKPVKKATPELESRAPLTRSLGNTHLFRNLWPFFEVARSSPQERDRAWAIFGRACFSLWRLSYAEKFHRCAKSVALPRWRGS